MVQELLSYIHIQSIYTAQLLNCGHSSNKKSSPLSQPCSNHTVESFDINYRPSSQSKAWLEKIKTLSAFKTHSPFQPCRSPRQTSLSGFCCRSSQWERPISCTWRWDRPVNGKNLELAHSIDWLAICCMRNSMKKNRQRVSCQQKI